MGWLKDVKAVTPDMVPDANRGMWHNANATVVKIMADKDIYYLAHPDNGEREAPAAHRGHGHPAASAHPSIHPWACTRSSRAAPLPSPHHHTHTAQ